MKKHVLVTLSALLVGSMLTGCGAAGSKELDASTTSSVFEQSSEREENTDLTTSAENTESAESDKEESSVAESTIAMEESSETVDHSNQSSYTVTDFIIYNLGAFFYNNEDSILATYGYDESTRTLSFASYDMQGNPLGFGTHTYPMESAWSYFFGKNSNNFFLAVTEEADAMDPGVMSLKLFDWNCQMILDTKFDFAPTWDYPTGRIDNPDSSEFMIVGAYESETLYARVDAKKGVIEDHFDWGDVTNSTYMYIDPAESEEVSYDTSKWGYYAPTINGKYRLVASLDQTEWGYVDENDNIVAFYADCSSFSLSGYAMATMDGLNYDLIDENLNVVEAGIAQGVGASLVGNTDSNLFSVRDAEGNYRFFFIQ